MIQNFSQNFGLLGGSTNGAFRMFLGTETWSNYFQKEQATYFNKRAIIYVGTVEKSSRGRTVNQ